MRVKLWLRVGVGVADAAELVSLHVYVCERQLNLLNSIEFIIL